MWYCGNLLRLFLRWLLNRIDWKIFVDWLVDDMLIVFGRNSFFLMNFSYRFGIEERVETVRCWGGIWEKKERLCFLCRVIGIVWDCYSFFIFYIKKGNLLKEKGIYISCWLIGRESIIRLFRKDVLLFEKYFTVGILFREFWV